MTTLIKQRPVIPSTLPPLESLMRDASPEHETIVRGLVHACEAYMDKLAEELRRLHSPILTPDQPSNLSSVPIPILRNGIKDIGREIKRTERLLLSYKPVLANNARRRIPIELWVMIFIYITPEMPRWNTDGPFLLSRVCSSWRSIAHSDRRLWPKVILSNDSNTWRGALAHLSVRGISPLVVVFDLINSPSAPLDKFFADEQIHNFIASTQACWTQLEVNTTRYTSYHMTWKETIHSLLSASMPLLETLVVNFYGSSTNFRNIGCVQVQVPALKTLVLEHAHAITNLHEQLTGFPPIQSLILRGMGISCDGNPTILETWLPSQHSSLTTLVLRAAESVAWVDGTPLWLPRLTTFHLGGSHDRGIIRILRRFHLPSLRHLQLANWGHAEPLYSLASLFTEYLPQWKCPLESLTFVAYYFEIRGVYTQQIATMDELEKFARSVPTLKDLRVQEYQGMSVPNLLTSA
ncbi:hypothetical protein CYLTODRAFT_273329 [Cylindrobasidium torrendii FP15055 ss-10]|uniref:F-box domain-containing protein n=1 Tax=Cylindrobasidium torrendii FP15055 ss-10 TaxID=1314674 RepID=A0A0D7BCX1_9AGAR|nr:hypothetical protein CYLTODRAFT_273329 [Cylindrobasidium torrendii FP15055 ss-10]